MKRSDLMARLSEKEQLSGKEALVIILLRQFSKRMGHYHVHYFPMPGLGFTLAVGKNIPALHGGLRGHTVISVIHPNHRKSLYSLRR
jgi:hypothetical protein